MSRPLTLFAALCLAVGALAAPAAAQNYQTKSPYVATPSYMGPPVPQQPARAYPTPRDPLQPQPNANANQINPYLNTNKTPTNSPLYKPYEAGKQTDAFGASSAYQGGGAKSYNQQRSESPVTPRECTNFDRMSDSYANCKSEQSKEAFHKSQLKARQQQQQQTR